MGLAEHIPTQVRTRLRPAKRAAQRRLRLVRRTLARPVQRRALRDVIREVQQLAPATPDIATAERLIRAWNNSAAADTSYLLTVIERAREAQGPILECGSGLTTLAMAIYAKQPVLSLESDAGWHRRLVAEMGWLGLSGPEVIHAPLREFEGFAWYDAPSLPDGIALVVCDGPPRRGKPGGRVGLLPVAGEHLATEAEILVDADTQVAEGEALEVWRSEYGFAPAEHRGSALILRRA